MSTPGRRTASGQSGRPGSRSSRRFVSPVPVELGGGAGILGPMTDEQAQQYAAHRFSTYSARSSTYRSSYHSPTGSLFSTSSKSGGAPSSGSGSPSKQTPPALPPATTASSTSPDDLVPPSSAMSGGWSNSSGSTRSIATNGGSSSSSSISRTPNSNMYAYDASTAGSYTSVDTATATRPNHGQRKRSAGRWNPVMGSFDDQPQATGSRPGIGDQTPRQHHHPSNGQMTPSSSAMSTSPPSSYSKATGKQKKKKVPAPIRTGVPELRHGTGLSQDWITVDEYGSIGDLSPTRPAPAPPTYVQPASTATAPSNMLPHRMARDVDQHTMQRAATDPAATSASLSNRRPSGDGLLNGFSDGPKGDSTERYLGGGDMHGRKVSNSTGDPNGRSRTPNGFEAYSGVPDISPAGHGSSQHHAQQQHHHHHHHHRNAPPPPPPPQPPLKTRRSMDLLRRPSAELLGFGARNEAKEAKAAAQKSLGSGTPPPIDGRKAPVLSLKKSSGALRNLFRGKSREPSDSVPDMPQQPQQHQPRPSFSDLLRPTPPLPPGASSPVNSSAPSFASSWTTKASSISSRKNRTESGGSLPKEEDKRKRVSPPVTDLRQSTLPPRSHSRPSLPMRDLPPLPPLSPGGSAHPSPAAESNRPTEPSPLSTSRLPSADTVSSIDKPSSSVASTAFETPLSSSRDLPQKAVSPAVSVGSAGSSATARPFAEESPRGDEWFGASAPSPPQSPIRSSPVKTSAPLSLLQLPELDLDFDFGSFDSIGLSSSPPTPKKRTLVKGSPANGSPTKRRSIIDKEHERAAASAAAASAHTRSVHRTSSELAKLAERRRSKSFDGPGSGAEDPWKFTLNDTWTSPNMVKLFSPSSSSAPFLATKGEEKARSPTKVATVIARTEVVSSVPSESDASSTRPASSIDHSRTPSGCSSTRDTSSTQETSSTSSPHTPEDAHSAFLASSPSADKNVPPSVLALDSPPGGGLEPPIELNTSFLGALNATRFTMDPTPSPSEPQTPTPVATAGARTPEITVAPHTPPPRPAPRNESAAAAAAAAVAATNTAAASAAVAAAAAKLEAKSTATAIAPSTAVAAAAAVLEPAKNGTTKAEPSKEPEEPKEPEQIPPSKAPFQARRVTRVLVAKATPLTPDSNVTLRDLGRELERSLENFRYPMQQSGCPERSMIIRNELLVYISELDKRCYNRTEEHMYAGIRDVVFYWAECLLYELRAEQAANERGACLEGLAAVLESQCLSADALEASPTHQDVFLRLMIRVMNFVMDKLGAKGVFHNTLLFSGRFLAFAFFRVPHVGGQLVGVLQPPRGALMRFTRPVLLGSSIPEEAQPRYPALLQPLCFDNSQAYTQRLLSLDPDFNTAEEKEAFHFQPGNWLRRWQSDDSELFPAFYRAYHRQLAVYLGPTIEYYQNRGTPVPAAVLFRAPGYAHLATIFAKKCHSYILGLVNAVTTSSSNNNFDATESAGFRGSQKPPVLETANRRLVETMWTFASSVVAIPSANGRMIESDGSQLWGATIDLWTKNLITKTSLYAPKGVFCLFDLLDGIVDPVQTGGEHSPLDVPYLIGLVRTILNEAEHALTIVKVIAFVFTHWEILTINPDNRRELCLDILLQRKLFERLLLFWSQSVRSYVLRLVVFRLGHLHTTKDDGISYEVEIESVRLLQTRLDAIKRRHDELEPRQASESDMDTTPHTPTAGIPRSRSTITMVPDSPQQVTKAERLMGLGLGGGAAAEDPDSKAKSSWWKRTLGGGSKPAKGNGAAPAKSGKKGKGSPSLPDRSPPVPALAVHTSSPPIGSFSPPRRATKLEPPLSPSSPITSHSPKTGNGNGPSSPGGRRKAPPPRIATNAPRTPEGKTQFQFEFELPTASPRSDAFDPVTSPASPATGSSRRSSQPPSPHGPTSPHMSAQFSKRSSLLPPPTASTLDSLGSVGGLRVPFMPRDPGYPKRLHAYAIRMLAELEDAQKEYDEWWADGGIGKVDGAPPRLAVAWPFHEGED